MVLWPLGLSSVAVFASATEGFAQANLGQSVDGSLATFAEVVTQAKQANLHVRGYVSCAFDCPYDGAVDPGQVSGVVERLLEMGCDEIAISDTDWFRGAGHSRRRSFGVREQPAPRRHRFASP